MPKPIQFRSKVLMNHLRSSFDIQTKPHQSLRELVSILERNLQHLSRLIIRVCLNEVKLNLVFSYVKRFVLTTHGVRLECRSIHS